MVISAEELSLICRRIYLYDHYKYKNKNKLKATFNLIIVHEMGKQTYTKHDFNKDIKVIKAFKATGIDVYNRDFLKIKLEESICAIASELSGKLKITYKIIDKWQ